jgi:hypothetical protein
MLIRSEVTDKQRPAGLIHDRDDAPGGRCARGGAPLSEEEPVCGQFLGCCHSFKPDSRPDPSLRSG